MASAGAARGRGARAGAGAGTGGVPCAPSPAGAALLARVAPLDRGLAARPADAAAVDAAAARLEGEGPAPTLGGGGMAALAGRWQLVYSSSKCEPRQMLALPVQEERCDENYKRNE